jgi:GAF domain-containing protein
VLGALSVQSAQPNAFDEAAVAVLQIMADQVAVALDNARLFVENQAALEQARRAFGEVSRQAWSELLRARADVGFRYAGKMIAPAAGEWSADMLQAARTSAMAEVQDPHEAALAVPIQVRDQVVGVLRFRKDGQALWTEQEKAVLGAVTEQIGLALESARLYQDTQRRAAQEQLTGTITAKMRESLDMERVLQTAADEMFQAFGLEEIAIQLTADDADGKSAADSDRSAV